MPQMFDTFLMEVATEDDPWVFFHVSIVSRPLSIPYHPTATAMITGPA
jgi:hypothetical protein